MLLYKSEQMLAFIVLQFRTATLNVCVCCKTLLSAAIVMSGNQSGFTETSVTHRQLLQLVNIEIFPLASNLL
jgi:hypothetical protein